MYAVLVTGGKQYRVMKGEVLRVEKLDAEEGKEISFDNVLMLGDSDGVKLGDDVKGATIKAVGAAARKELSEMFETPVHLFLFVKVRANWGDDPERYREMGLEFPKA